MSKRSDFRKYLISACINTFAGSHLCPMRIRRHILRLFGHQIGTIFPEYFIGIGKGRLKIEDSSFCNYRCFFDMSNDITIGKNCSVAFGVTFVTSTHMIGPSEKRAMGGANSPIIVGNGCWIGANVVILPGVTIGQGCVIAAGAVVTKSTQPDGLYAGIPAIRIRDLK